MPGILVVGPRRTGTTLITGILHHLGIHVDLTPNDPASAYYESTRLAKITNHFVRYLHFPQTHFIEDDDQRAIYEWSSDLDSQHPQWAAKVPQLALCGHLIFPSVLDCRVIMTERNFDESVASLCKMYPYIDEGTARWIHGQASAAMLMNMKVIAEEGINSCRIPFQYMIDHPTETVMGLLPFLFGDEADYPPDEVILSAIAFIDPSQKHFTKPDHATHLPLYGEWLK